MCLLLSSVYAIRRRHCRKKIEGTWQHSQDWRHTGVQQKSIYSKYFSLPFFAKDMPGFPILGLDPSSTTVGLRVPRHKGLSISTSNNQHSNVQMPSSIEALYVTARESSLECVIELIVENANLVHDSTNDRVTLLSWPFVVGDWIGLHRSGSRSEDTSLMGFSCLRKPMRKQECSSRSTDEIIEPLRQQVDLHSFLGNCVILFEELPRLLARCSDDGTATEGEQEKWFAWKFPASFERMCHLAASASGNNL
eukprot:gb/GECG01013420.1/.p1 GENE.gb/GECG01013420.1/~~gb/GECG01013420.1/.p1  ORF type:complete len:251 (+),score=24.12 gb/GECG01013420.1/:1-753(+)